MSTSPTPFQATALLELGMNSIDGTGVTLSWPLVQSAAALLTEVKQTPEDGAAEAADSRLGGGNRRWHSSWHSVSSGSAPSMSPRSRITPPRWVRLAATSLAPSGRARARAR